MWYPLVITYGYLYHLKKFSKNTGLLLVIALYCCVIGLYHGNSNHDAFAKLVSFNQPVFNKALAGGTFIEIVQSEISGAILNASRPVPVKSTQNDIITGIKTAEQLFLHRITQYSFYSKNLLIRLQKTALIFPFHYFW